MIAPKQVLLDAIRTGQQWNPKYPELHELTEADVSKLSLMHPLAKLLIKSRQESDGNYPTLVRGVYGREPDFDGELGLATELLLNIPRCPIPDYAPPPKAKFRYQDPALQQICRRMQDRAATGAGSWPMGCHGGKDHEVTVSYDLKGLPQKVIDWWPTIKKHNADAVAAMGLRVIEVPLGQRANVTFYPKSFFGSTIGMAQFNDGTCGDSVFCTISPRYNPNLRMTLILFMHEFGHTMGFTHSNRFIMNSSIMDVPEFWVQWGPNGQLVYKDVRYDMGKKFFGGFPLDPVSPNPTWQDFLAV